MAIRHRATTRRWLILAVVAVLVGLGVDTSFVVGLVGLVLPTPSPKARCSGGQLVGAGRACMRGGRWPSASGVAVLLDTRLLMNPAASRPACSIRSRAGRSEIARGAGLTAPLLLALLDGGILILAVVGSGRVSAPSARHPVPGHLADGVADAGVADADARGALPGSADAAGRAAGRVRAAAACAPGWSRPAARTTVLGLVGLVPVVTAGLPGQRGLRANLSPWGSSGVVLVAGLLLAGLLAFNLLRGAGAWRGVRDLAAGAAGGREHARRDAGRSRRAATIAAS